MPFIGMACNDWTRASIRLCTLSGWCGRCRKRLERMPQVRSVGLMYGYMAGQLITRIPVVSPMKGMYTWAAWESALSCITMNASSIAHECCLTIRSRISLRCIAAIIPPLGNTNRWVWPTKSISVQNKMSPIVPVNFDNVTLCVTFSMSSPHHSTSSISWFRETALICEEYWHPVTNLPVLMLASKVESQCTVLRSENWAMDRSSGSHTITMEFIPNDLVCEVNFSGTTQVNFQRFSCTHVIVTRQQYEHTVLMWGTTLPLSPGVLSCLLVTCP